MSEINNRLTENGVEQWVDRADKLMRVRFVIFGLLLVSAIALVSTAVMNPEPDPTEPDSSSEPEETFIATDGLARVVAGASAGTAFLVSRTEALTAAHVVGLTGSQVSLQFENGRTVSGTVSASGFEEYQDFVTETGSVQRGAVEHDWAVIELSEAQPFENTYSLHFTGSIDAQAEIRAAGYPGGGDLNISSGVISGISDEAIQIDAGTDPGYSGGPIFRVSDQLVVGVIVSTPVINGQRAASVSYGLDIQRLLEKANASGVLTAL